VILRASNPRLYTADAECHMPRMFEQGHYFSESHQNVNISLITTLFESSTNLTLLSI
jgi:hypothetical protein